MNTTERIEWTVAISIIFAMAMVSLWLYERGQVGFALAFAASSLGYLGIPGQTDRLQRKAAEYEAAALEDFKQRYALITKAL